MEAYTSFASVYDALMDNIPYEEWAAYLQEILREYGIADGLVLDLGCGTGSLTELLAAAGYDMIGVDYSDEMLDVAVTKRDVSGHDILYLSQDMRELELYGTVKAVVSICDSMNYITAEEEVEEVFRLVNNYLDPGGMFIFDFNTVYKYETILGEQTIAENREYESFIWENFYDSTSQMNEYDLTLFIRDRNLDAEVYRKYEETHFQKAYDYETMKRLIDASGLTFVKAYDAFTRNEPHAKSERIYMIAREHGKSTIL